MNRSVIVGSAVDLLNLLRRCRIVIAVRRRLRKVCAEAAAQRIVEDRHAHYGKDDRPATHDGQERTYYRRCCHGDGPLRVLQEKKKNKNGLFYVLSRLIDR